MAALRRIEISLEKDEHERLKALADEEGVSLPQLIRRLIERELTGGPGTDRSKLRAIRGIGAGGGFSGRHHDSVL